MENPANIVSILSLIFSFIGLAAVISTFILFLRDIKIPPALNAEYFYWNFFVKEYLDGEFKFNNDTVDFKSYRLEIEKEYMDNKEWRKNEEEEEAGYSEFSEKSLDHSTIENKFCYRIGLELNRIGQAAFTGALPVKNVLSISAEMILADWEKASLLVKKQIAPQPNEDDADKRRRNFFKWLALVSAIYLICISPKNVNYAKIAKRLRLADEKADLLEEERKIREGNRYFPAAGITKKFINKIRRDYKKNYPKP